MLELQEEQSKFLSGKAVKKLLQVSDNTLRRWANEGKINFIRNTSKGKRYYDITSILNYNADSGKLKSTFIKSESCISLDSVITNESDHVEKITKASETKCIYAYCRPTPDAGVTKQESKIIELYNNVKIIKSTCSNKDWKYNKILDIIITDAHANKIDKLILYNNTIISKIYFPMIEHTLKLFNVDIIILNK